MNLRAVFRNVGLALLVSALFMLFSILVSVADGNDSALSALMISCIMTFTVGVFPFIFVRKTTVISMKEGYLIIVLSWLLSFIFGMMPYVLWGGPFTVVNAFFESVSGFTTTGGTILDNIEALPRSLLFWRASTHFIGGLGVVVFLMLFIPKSSPMRLRLASLELSSLSKEDYRARANKTVLIFTSVYLGLALVSTGLYLLGGMPLFDAVTNSFTICSTGGFCIRNLSLGAYGSDYINIVTTIMMVVASLNFAILYVAVVNRTLKPFRNATFKYYIGLLLCCTAIVAVAMKAKGIESGWGGALMNSSFHVASYASGTGLAIADNSGWTTFIIFVLLCLSFHGGMAGSTTGGLKSDRVLLLFKAVKNQVTKSLHPYTVSNVRHGSRIVKMEEIYPHLVFFVLSFIVFILSVLFCYLLGNGEYSITATIANLYNVGLSFGDIGSTGSYNWMNAATKILLCLDMFVGRLEIYPVLAVLSMLFSRKERS